MTRRRSTYSFSSLATARFLLSPASIMKTHVREMKSSAGDQRRDSPAGSSLLSCPITSASSLASSSSSALHSGEGASSSRNGCPRREETTSFASGMREISSEKKKEKKGKRLTVVKRDRRDLVRGNGLYASSEGYGSKKNLKKRQQKEKREEDVGEDLWKEDQSDAQGSTKEGGRRGGDRKDQSIDEYSDVMKEGNLAERPDICGGDRYMGWRRKPLRRSDCDDNKKKLVDTRYRQTHSHSISLPSLSSEVSCRSPPYVGDERIVSSRRTVKTVTTVGGGDDRREEEDETETGGGETRQGEGGCACMRRRKKREGLTRSEKRQEHVKETQNERDPSHMDKNLLDGCFLVEEIYLDALVTGACGEQQEGKEEEKENNIDGVLSMAMKRLRQDEGKRKRKMKNKKKRLFFLSSPWDGSTGSAVLLTSGNKDWQRMNSLFNLLERQSSIPKRDRKSFSSCLSPPPYMRFGKKEARGGGKIPDSISFHNLIPSRMKGRKEEKGRDGLMTDNERKGEGGGGKQGIGDEEGRNLWSCLSSSSSFSVTTDSEIRDEEKNKKQKGYEGYAKVVFEIQDDTVSKGKQNRLSGLQEEKEEIVFFPKGSRRGRLDGDVDVLVMRENKKNEWVSCPGRRRADLIIGESRERSERRRRRQIRSLSTESLPHFYVVKKNRRRRSSAVMATPSFHLQRGDSLYKKKNKKKQKDYSRRLSKHQENEGVSSLKEDEQGTKIVPDASRMEQQGYDERIEKEKRQVGVLSCTSQSQKSYEQVETKEGRRPSSSRPRQDSQKPEKKERTLRHIPSSLSFPFWGRSRTEGSVAHFPSILPCGSCVVSSSLSPILPVSPQRCHHPTPSTYPLLSSTPSSSPFIPSSRSILPLSFSPPILSSPPVLASSPPLVPLPGILSSAPPFRSSPSLVSSAPLLPSPPVVSSPPLLPSPPMLPSPRALLPTSSSVRLPCAHYFPQNMSACGRSSLPVLSVARGYSRPVFPSASSSPPILSSPRLSPTSSSLLGRNACAVGHPQSNRTVSPARPSSLLPSAPPLLSSPPPVSFTPSISPHSACPSPLLSRTSNGEGQGEDKKRTVSSLCKASSSVSFSREDGSLQMFFNLFSQAKGDPATMTSRRRETGSLSDALEPACGRHSDTSLVACTTHARAASRGGMSAVGEDISGRSPTVSTASSSLPSVGGTLDREGGGGYHVTSSIVKKETTCISSSTHVNSCSTSSRRLLTAPSAPQECGKERQKEERRGGGKGVRDDDFKQEKASGRPRACIPVIRDGESSQRGSREGFSLTAAVACADLEEKLEGLSSVSTSSRTYVTAVPTSTADVRMPVKGNGQGEEEEGALPMPLSDHRSMVSLSSTAKTCPSKASFTLLELLKCKRKTPEPPLATVLLAQGSSLNSRTSTHSSSSSHISHFHGLGYNRGDRNVEEGCNAFELERKGEEREEVVSTETDVQFSSSSFLSSILSSFAYDISGKTACSSDCYYRETSETSHYPTDSCLVHRDIQRHDDSLFFTPYEAETGDRFFSSSTRAAGVSTAQELSLDRDERKGFYTTKRPAAETSEEVFLSLTERKDERSSWKIERGMKPCEVVECRREVGRVFAIPSFMQTPSPHTVPFPPSFFQM
ncbi:hypothetical protein CSUI_002599 [Cystoisospora suis]|uniref:Uncharacterized protein n=1 Tax=Cystoisospora suis TaxID=483139 RepID=A0A2C6KTD2_9APIC|nr:hypothetical protein CSUI_002599 [Cystoisospora suis]